MSASPKNFRLVDPDDLDRPIYGARNIAIAAGVVEGKSCTAYPAVGPEVKRAGGKWVDTPVDQAHVDGNLVTAPAWPAHPQWLAKFLQVLGTKIEP